LISPDELNIAAEVSQLSLYSELEGLYAETKKIHADLRPFERVADPVDDGDGIAMRIPIIAYVESTDIIRPYKECREVEASELPSIINSLVTPITEDYPIVCYNWNDTLDRIDMFFRPITQSYGVKYIAAPTAPDWAYTITSGRPVYNAGSTVDFGFDETLFLEISRRVLSHIGINIGKEEVTQYAMAAK